MPTEGRYANYFMVGHADCEVVIEFGQHYEGEAEPMAHTRIIMSPLNAARLVELLTGSLKEYEATHGPITGDC